MALVSGGRFTLNPNAPLFVPAAFRQVEDFSPQWWQLITTSTWFHEYWLSQPQDEDAFYDTAADSFDNSDLEIVDLLPDEFEFTTDDDLSSLEPQFDGFVETYESQEEKKPINPIYCLRQLNGLVLNLE